MERGGQGERVSVSESERWREIRSFTSTEAPGENGQYVQIFREPEITIPRLGCSEQAPTPLSNSYSKHSGQHSEVN